MTRINAEQLQKLHGCQAGIDFLIQYYPDGAELMDLINDKRVTDEFLHWGRTYLNATKEEIAAYENRVIIKDSSDFAWSNNVARSKYVGHSNSVANSSFVFYSKNVVDSTQIHYSKFITKSEYISLSSYITRSQMLDKCIDCDGIINAYNCKICYDSRDLYLCQNVDDSRYLIKCQNLVHSMLCFDCKNGSNMILCSGFTETEEAKQEPHKYYIMNKEVSQKAFERVWINLSAILYEPMNVIKSDWQPDCTEAIKPEIETDLRKLYSIESKKAILDYVQNLNEYDEINFKSAVIC